MARLPTSHSRFWLGFAILVAATPAVAEELVMPFSCTAPDGVVRLRPTEMPHGYHIYGPRERHVYSVCSPVDPDRCRNWMIHRFDVDCGGARVSWLDIVASASRFRRSRAWIEDGQLHLSVGPAWSPDRGGLFPRRRLWRNGGDDEFETVALPPGFAPTLGMPVQFVADNDGPATSGDRPGARADGTWDAPARDALPRGERMAEDGPPPGWNASPRPPQPQKSERSAAAPPGKTAPMKETAPPKEKAAAPASGKPAEKSAAPAAPPAEAAPATPAPAKSEPPKPADGPKLPDGVVMPTIINGSHPAPATRPADAPARAEPPAAPPAAPAAAPEAHPEVAASAPPPTTPPPAEESQKIASASQTATDTNAAALDTGSLPASAPPWAALMTEPRVVWGGAAAVGALMLAAAYLMSRRRDGAPDPLLGRDLASVTFEAPPAGGTSLVAFAPAPAPALPEAGPRGLVATDLPGDAGVVPTSLEEAFAVLGTNADAPTEVIKKIVDGLRQSWHSDLARSDEDRAFRERRMQQVNAAWELVLRSRRAAA